MLLNFVFIVNSLIYCCMYAPLIFSAAVLLPVKCSRDFQAVRIDRVSNTIHTTQDIITHLSCAKVESWAHTPNHWKPQSGVQHTQKMSYLWPIIVQMWCLVGATREQLHDAGQIANLVEIWAAWDEEVVYRKLESRFIHLIDMTKPFPSYFKLFKSCDIYVWVSPLFEQRWSCLWK